MARCAVVTALALAAACAERTPAPLELLEFRQNELAAVALNEELRFYFSAELDRTSVTTDSVRVVDDRGRDVAGTRIVRGRALTFRPELPLAPDLSDGGLRPGRAYRVVLGGFPRPDGLRSESGALLSSSLVLSFGTAELGAGLLFLDVDPHVPPRPLEPLGRRKAEHVELEDGRIVLASDQALDPSSVPHASFELYSFRDQATLPLVARLAVNRRDRAELVLEPLDEESRGAPLPPGTYYLRMLEWSLRSLGGRSVGLPPPLVRLFVPDSRVVLDFTRPDALAVGAAAGERAPGCESTAHQEDGGLVLRYPAAAGDGEDGEVELGAAGLGGWPDRDVHATRLLVPAGEEADLGGVQGPIVLRAQGLIDVRGRLRRRGRGASGALGDELAAIALAGGADRPTLESFLARLLDPDAPWKDEPWTVLVAGGDIVVPEGGAIDVEGPLVLVAGGRIRVEGHNVVTQGDLWMAPEGGGVAHGRIEPLPLALAPPELDPLRIPLAACAVSRPLKWTPRSGRWSTTLVGDAGAGRLDVAFLQASGPGRPERIVADPADLEAGDVRVLVRLEVGPGAGGRWDPPRLERVELEALPPR